MSKNLQTRAWSTWACVAYGARLMRLQAATDLGTPDNAHDTAARKDLDALLALLDDRVSRQAWML
jgi:GST-like protein